MICEATPEQIEYIAHNLRRSDIDELSIIQPFNPDNFMFACLRNKCYCFEVDEPISLFGFTDRGREFEAWVVATNKINRHGITFLRESIRIFNQFERLMAHVYSKNMASNKWLTRIGMTHENDIVVNNETFYVWRKK